ncbi:MAG: trypsin-like peptidase domain-containing protein [Anaerolineales bacterium]
MPNILVELSNAFASAVETAGKATVMVNARRRMPATGIAYAADLVLTADHAVERDENLSVTLFNGSEISASLAGRDPGNDLALLRLERSEAFPASAADDAKIGQLVLALGRPSTDGIEASLGVVSALGGPLRTPRGMIERYLRTDTTMYPGFSGGPLIDSEGRVVGVNTSFGRGMPFSIPAGVAWKTAEQLARHGSIRRGYLGIRSQMVEVPSAGQQALNREQATGLLVMGIEANTPASQGWLIVGDILVGLNGHPVRDHDELFALLTGDLVGQSTPVEILRGGQPQVVLVLIGEAPVAETQRDGRHHGHGRGK